MNLHEPLLSASARRHATPVTPPGPRHVCVLMGVRDGAAFLESQLSSIASQHHEDWSVVVADDGSRDDSTEIIRRFAAAHPTRSVRLVPGPGRGFQANYLRLLSETPAAARYVAFADQDDVWLPDRLARGLDLLAATEPGRPALYGGRTVLTDAKLVAYGRSPRFRRPPSFRNALVQSVAGGNTMLMNRAAADLLRRAAARTDRIVSHDWWAYQLVSGCGGRVIYDERPTVLYRQHGGNLVGAGAGVRAKLRRLAALWRGDFRGYTDINLSALESARDLLAPENRALVAALRTAREAPFFQRLGHIARAGLYRQTMAGTVALWTAAVLGRL